VTESSTLTSTVAGRYATALFDLALESDALETAEADTDALRAALGESDDLARLIRSPLYTREQQAQALAALGEAMGLSGLTRNLMGLMAQKRRLFVLPEVIELFGRLLAEHRGEVTAEITAARPLSDAQVEALKETLRGALESEVKLNVTIDPAIIGGLVVRVGSRMIDTSIRSRLAGLQNAMREVG
jgi:F-type H+-transporting ATPase subunit delta